MVEVLLSGIVLGMVPVTILGLFVAAAAFGEFRASLKRQVERERFVEAAEMLHARLRDHPFALAAGGDISCALAGYPFLSPPTVTDAVLSSQALRMGPTGLTRRVVPPGNFTQNRPILQLPWECDYIGARGEATAPENAVPAIPSLEALDTQLTVVWQLVDAPETGPAGWLHATDGSRVEVALPEAGDVLIAVGGGPGRWRPSGSGLLAVGYQLGVLSPAQNFYLEYSPDEVRGYPLELQRLLGFHMPGAVINKFYAGPGPHDILGGDGILGGRRVDWADQGETPPVSIDTAVQFLPRVSRGILAGVWVAFFRECRQ